MVAKYQRSLSHFGADSALQKVKTLGGVMIHRVELQIQEVEARQVRDGGKCIVMHQAVSRQVKLPARTEE